MASSSASLRPPQQARSRQSLDRILGAAELVLRERDFRDATLKEIAAKAGYSIGAIYARLPDKQALLRALEERVYENVERLTGTYAVPDAWTDRPLEELVRILIERSIALYREHRGVLRALVVLSRSDPMLRDRIAVRNAETLNRFAAAVQYRRQQVAHENLEAASAFAACLIGSVLRDVVLFQTVWPAPAASTDDTLAAELTRAVVGYLTGGRLA